jgi:iron(III) transport system substrate-binding protein
MNAMKRCLILLLIGVLCLPTACQQSDSSREFVVAYVAVDRQDAEPILRDFTQQTGIEVRCVYDAEFAKTTGLVSRIVAEAEHPRCDVFWNNENVQTLALAKRGLLAEHISPNAADLPNTAKDPAGKWSAVATRARVIVYNTRHVSADDAPRSIFELVQPKWRGKVAIANPQFGTTRTHIAGLFAALGPEAAQSWLRGLLENEVRIVDGNALVMSLVARADPTASPIFVGLTDTDDVLSGIADGEPIAMIYPDQDTLGTLIVPSTLCLLNGAPHPTAARRLIDYLLAPQTVQRFAREGTGYTSVRAAQASGESPAIVKPLTVTDNEIFAQLEASSLWTSEHFHP